MDNTIENIGLSQLPNGAHFNYMQATIERTEADSVAKAKVPNELPALKSAFAAEDECLNVSRKDPLSDRIGEADTRRDSYYTGYKNAVKGFLHLPEGDMLATARTLWQHIADYKIDTKDQLDKETGMLTNFIDDLQGKFASQVAALGLKPFVDNLKTANEETRELLIQRDTGNSSKTVGATKAARQATDEAYRKLIAKINAYATLDETGELRPFVDAMNAQILRYKRNVLGHPATPPATPAEPGQPAEPDQPTEPGDDSPDEI
ncbi:DUF6261 family protein [Parabacteroides sp. ZJ-118]|uniref:DUF6261 family protein n=1 Tax=Parabacteroides sp. ZJ-118 TaxID=2709398 RepID=UPI0013ECB908|nr:DUF6261 family protein [Parabacteroides sp. ZJ-118]